MVFDPQVFIEAINDAVRDGVDGGLHQIQERAKGNAPVRKIFKGGGGKISIKGPIGVTNQSVNGIRGPSFRYSQRAGMVVGIGSSGRAFAHPAFARIESTGRLAGDVKRNRDAVRYESRSERINKRGRVNSQYPVFAVPGIGRVTGDFRDLSDIGVIAAGVVYARVGGKTKSFSVEEAMTTRGRYEVGRAESQGREEVGGALRDAIEIEGPFVSNDEVYGFVSVSVADPGRTFNYARAQEFGTAHNRPQPFLRPALRSLHDLIVKDQRNSFSTALRSAVSKRRESEIGAQMRLDVEFVGFNDRLADRLLGG